MLLRLIGFAILMLSGFLLAFLLLVGYTVRTMMRPPRKTYGWAVTRNLPGDPLELAPPREFRSFTFKSRGHELCAWDMAGDFPGGPVLVISGGWGESRVTMLERATALAGLASRIVLWDLPGHGDSQGVSSLGAHESEDLLRLCEALAASDVLLYGFSLGAGISIEAAARNQTPCIRGVIAEAPYRVPLTPARNVLDRIGVPSGPSLTLSMMIIGLDLGYGLDLGTSKLYDRVTHAATLAVPLLVLHGANDAISPPADGRAIADAAKGQFLLLNGTDHVNLWQVDSSRLAAFAAIETFCRDALNTRTIGDAKRVEQSAG